MTEVTTRATGEPLMVQQVLVIAKHLKAKHEIDRLFEQSFQTQAIF